MKGTRIHPDADGFLDPELMRLPGAYGRCTAYDQRFPGHAVTAWQVTAPTGGQCNLSGHKVVEHADGTITATPSILIDWYKDGRDFHGYLEKGIWRKA